MNQCLNKFSHKNCHVRLICRKFWYNCSLIVMWPTGGVFLKHKALIAPNPQKKTTLMIFIYGNLVIGRRVMICVVVRKYQDIYLHFPI